MEKRVPMQELYPKGLACLMAKEGLSMLLEDGMKVNGDTADGLAQAALAMEMATSTKVNYAMITSMEKGPCGLQMVVCLWVSTGTNK